MTKSEAIKLEQLFLDGLNQAQEAFDKIIETEAWIPLGYDSYADWWRVRVVPIMRALSMRPTREIVSASVNQIKKEDEQRPQPQRHTQQEIGKMMGVDRETVARHDPQRAAMPPTDDLDETRSTIGTNVPNDDLDPSKSINQPRPNALQETRNTNPNLANETDIKKLVQQIASIYQSTRDRLITAQDLYSNLNDQSIVPVTEILEYIDSSIGALSLARTLFESKLEVEESE